MAARRPVLRAWCAVARRALQMLRLWWALPGMLLLAGAVWAAPGSLIVSARYAEPTPRYDHGILGDAIEWGALVLRLEGGESVTIRLPDTRVFEDIAPRLVKGNDGTPLVMVVETDLALGARLALYDATGPVAATPFIGRPHRWLAPIGAADLDGDGKVEVAYIDRPHLARILRVWRLTANGLVEVAAREGLTNHQIGWDFIPGGIRDCGAGPEMIVASGDWRQAIAVALKNGRLIARPLGAYSDPESLNSALNCGG